MCRFIRRQIELSRIMLNEKCCTAEAYVPECGHASAPALLHTENAVCDTYRLFTQTACGLDDDAIDYRFV